VANTQSIEPKSLASPVEHTFVPGDIFSCHCHIISYFLSAASCLLAVSTQQFSKNHLTYIILQLSAFGFWSPLARSVVQNKYSVLSISHFSQIQINHQRSGETQVLHYRLEGLEV
jgi:hypothetical protein